MSSGPLLLDTNILLELVRDKDLGKHISSQFNLKSAVHRPLISIVTVGEIWALATSLDLAKASERFSRRCWQRSSYSISTMSRCWMRM